MTRTTWNAACFLTSIAALALGALPLAHAQTRDEGLVGAGAPLRSGRLCSRRPDGMGYPRRAQGERRSRPWRTGAIVEV